MRLGVVDIGTNSTRLLIADVDPASGRIAERDRRSQVTHLGAGVDASGRLSDAAMERVFATLDAYRQALDADEVPADGRIAVLTSAVRDAANGADFTATVRDRYGLDAHTIAGEREARLTFLGATHGRDPEDRTPLLVFDIGGGSTELGRRPPRPGRLLRLDAARRRAPERAPPAQRPAAAERAAGARR